ncbi:MAG TPA: ribokinase [Anaerolineae bacterium]|nr:ribokinase [Anaerolineae bacterium]
MPRPKIVVVGSANTDMVVRTEHLPLPGETVLGGKFVMTAGGKGANQAVAAARLGAEVTFVARLGRDVFGDRALAGYQAEGINIAYIVRDDEEASGVALIVVDEAAENIITVAPGANGRLSADDVRAAEAIIAEADGVLLQLEIPLEAVHAAIKLARQHNIRVILNPAPARDLPDEILHGVDVLTPNESEAARLVGGDLDPKSDVLATLAARGPRSVIMTRGAHGCEVLAGGLRQHVDGFQVEAIDTTGAGDCFNGALAVALAHRLEMAEAVRYASAAAALTVTRLGAQTSMPADEEVRQFLQVQRILGQP